MRLLPAAAAAVSVPVALVLGLGLGASGDTTSGTTDTACHGTVGAGMYAGRGGKLGEPQARNAQTIWQVSVQLKLPDRAAIIAIAAAMQEDRLRNTTTASDHDSLGLFQMRPTHGWGTAAQVTDPVYASKKFYERLVRVPNWQNRPLTEAAQAVEHSAFPNAYAQWEPLATKLVAAFTKAATTCSAAVTTGGLGPAILAQGQRWLGLPYQYGGGDQNGPSVGLNSRGDGVKGFDCSGLTVYAVYHASGGKILLPRTSGTQWQDKRWRHVTYNDLQPGDLVFWAGTGGTPSAPGHVGIYAGGHRFLNAPQTGSNVRYDSMAPGTTRYRTFLGGARITTVGSR